MRDLLILRSLPTRVLSRLNKRHLTCVLLLLTVTLGAQKSDWDIISKTTFTQKKFETKRKVTYLFAGKNALVKYNPLSLAFGGLMLLYQSSISTQIGAACPYEINCSNFSKMCIQQYGLLKGIPLTADRLTRCTRLAFIDMTGGVDYSARRGSIFDHPDDYRRH
jgi:uncharacterized protein